MQWTRVNNIDIIDEEYGVGLRYRNITFYCVRQNQSRARSICMEFGEVDTERRK